MKSHHCKFNSKAQCGFSLVETIVAMTVTMIVLTTCLSLLLVNVKTDRRAIAELLTQHDIFLFQAALRRDIHSAQGITANGSTLFITRDDGIVNDYRFNPSSGIVYKSVDGSGTAILATSVTKVQYTILPHVGVMVAVYFNREEFTFHDEWSAAFLEGKPKL